MFSYSRNENGIRKRYELPYDPTDIGFSFKSKSSCCLYFIKGDYELRVRMGSNVVFFYKVEDRINLVTPGYVAEDVETLKNKLKKWI